MFHTDNIKEFVIVGTLRGINGKSIRDDEVPGPYPEGICLCVNKEDFIM